MHSHCAMSNEREIGKGGKTSMCHHASAHCTQPYVALNNLHVGAVDGGGGILRRGSWVQTWANHPTLSATPADSPDFSWVLPSCRALICQSSSSPPLVHHPAALPTSPVVPLVDTESSVKGRPLRPMHPCVLLGHRFSDPTPLTFRWLTCDFSMGDLPRLCSREPWGAAVDCMLRLFSVQEHHVHVSLFQDPPLSPGGLCLVSFMDQWGDAQQQMWHFIHWREHRVVHERRREQHLAPYHRRHAGGKLTSPELLLDLLPRGTGGEGRKQDGPDPDTCARRPDTCFNFLSRWSATL